MTDQPPSYPPPPPGGYGYPPPPPAGGYGYPPPGYPPPPMVGTNGFAVASLVCSLFGWVCMFIGAFLGIIFGFVALSQIKRTGQKGRGMAIAGIVIGAIALVAGVALWTLAALLPHTPSTDSGAPAVVKIVRLQAV
ncbi:hypothetical protein A5696_15325 [Mycobacterium sp. E2699]|uniref:DUF4190 domain-containing protein n=1 Tax=Mycobacterium sp. E2699 TaxID=1834137 RepID=UPI000802009A|nr:DUF4190 domain-containing protein [Mycobacterium sp. E2699]OBH00731.1 hypothetical protein A5696_15325 [Mycobacterium sp. E2699]